MSGYAYTPLILPVLASTLIIAALVGYCWRHRTVPGAVALAVAMTLFLPWTIGEALGLAAVDPSIQRFWTRFEAMWPVGVVTAVLCFALQFANLDRWLTRRNIVALSLPALLAALLAATNPADDPIWRGGQLGDGVEVLSRSVRWALFGYMWVLAAAITLVFLWLFVRSPVHRWPVAACLLGQTVVRIGGALDVTGANPFAPVDAAVLGGTFSSAMYAVALFGFRMFDVIPVARRTVIEQMGEGMLVLDAKRRIVDLNREAESIFGVPASQLWLRDADELFRRMSVERPEASGGRSETDGIRISVGAADRVFARHESALADRYGRSLGFLVLLHDVTAQRDAQLRLVEQQRALATLQERDRVARELHDSIGQVMGYVKMQVQTARLLLADRPAEADSHLAQAAAVAQEAHADIREYIIGARTGLSRAGLVTALEEYLRALDERHDVETTLTVGPELASSTLDPSVEVQLLRIIQEALTNVRKHGGARQAMIRLDVVNGHVRAIVQDDGRGFEVSAATSFDSGRFGLSYMRERAAEVGGEVAFDSTPGRGTVVTITVPIGGQLQ